MSSYNTDVNRDAGALLTSVSSITNVTPGERIISVVSGLALAVAGVRHFERGKGISLILGGGYLLARGITGYCAVNALLNKSKAVNAALPQATGTFKVLAY
ncbi:DUF2892 domain-containing protein [Ohtaekwangia kribbensis]|uniref:DUF2892 domain-containing protein n=1 Tax=Ohtaekwangia kribbensis TaxID=688913 RepID=A0ABW3JY05_9BACT